MPILSICADRLEELGRRKKAIAYRIALQRTELQHEIDRLRHPVRSFDRVRAASAGLAQYGPVIALVAAPLLFLLRRPLVGGIGAAARLARGAARWWALWKVGSRVVARLPEFVRR